jgi:prepilin-type N-terminal cleavage/methylation domain-containing protein
MKGARTRISDNRGLTLIEVVISISILTIVISIIFSFMDFSVRSFEAGVDQVDEQGALRITALKLTDELRNVFEIELKSNTQNITKSSYIYLDGSTLTLNQNSSVILLSEPVIQDINFELLINNDRYVLKFELMSKEKSISSEILLNNIQEGDIKNTPLDGSFTNGKVIEYRKMP